MNCGVYQGGSRKTCATGWERASASFPEADCKVVTVILQKRISCVCFLKISPTRSSSSFSEIGGERISLARRAVRAARAASHSHPWSQHAMRSSRVPEIFDRACAHLTPASLSTTAMLFLQHGVVNLAGRPPSSMVWSRALRAADPASRMPPNKTLMAASAAARISSTKQWLLKKSLWPDVSLRLLAHLHAIPCLTSPLEP